MELIDRKEAFNTIPKIIITPPRNGKMLWVELIDEWHKNMAELPIIESRPKGKWIKESDDKVMGDGFLWNCSECGQNVYVDSVNVFPNFCERCGADMRCEE